MKPKRNYTTKAEESNPRDRCQTPEYALDPLIPFLRSDWALWEAAAGEGLLVQHLHTAGFPHVIAGDILTGQNYFAYEPDAWDAQVTNPPFSIKFRWLERAYRLSKPFALLMPVEVLGAVSAQRLFERYGVEVIFFDKRIDYKMPNKGTQGSGAQFPSAWFTWGLNIGRQMTFAHILKGKRRKQARLQLPLAIAI